MVEKNSNLCNYEIMKRIIRCILIFFAFCHFPLLHFASLAFADESSNWGVQQPSVEKTKQGETSEKIWDNEQAERLYDDYGSPDSPGFLNREGIDPRDSTSEDDYDYEDDAPYNYDAGGN